MRCSLCSRNIGFMCGRVTLTHPDMDEIAALCGAEWGSDLLGPESYRPRFNVAPTDRHWIVRPGSGHSRLLVPATWGMTGSKVPLVINARAESAAEKPMFRRALRERRCAVVTDGFYEWVSAGGRARLPIWFHRPAGGLLLLAGLYDESPRGVPPRFVVLTTAANQMVTPVHDRMPAIIPPDRLGPWLEAGDPGLLTPAAEDTLVATPVSTRVNSVANDDPSCLEPPTEPAPDTPPPVKQKRQLGLFDES